MMSQAQAAGPVRVLGVFDASCVVIGAIIGVGIFFTPSGVVRLTGSGPVALVAWAVAGVIALCGALVFAELGSRCNASGAQYEILRGTYGRLVAFTFVFCNATAIQAGAAAIIAAVCVQNLSSAMGVPAPEGWRLTMLASALIAGVTFANVRGVRAGAAIQNVTVVAKLVTLLALAGAALVAMGSSPSRDTAAVVRGAMSPVMGVMASLSIAFFAYGGWQHALWICGEVKDPVRTLPRAIVGGVVVVVAVYLIANWAYLSLLGAAGVAQSRALAADAVGVVWPGAGGRVIAGAVALSALGVLNAQLLSGPRLVYRMASEGQFFGVFGRVSRSGTPAAAVVLIGVMAACLLAAAGVHGVDKLTTGVVFIDGIFFALTAACLMVERRRERLGGSGSSGAGAGVYRSPLYPAAPVVFIAGELALLTGAYFDASMRQAAWIGLAWIAVAIALYLVFFRGGGLKG